MANIAVKMKNVRASKRALVDDEDFERVNALKWCEGSYGYPRHRVYIGFVNGKGVGKMLSMHRFVMNAPPGQRVDHINGNVLDNRKGNLRFCTHSENLHNVDHARSDSMSGLRGITRVPNGRWKARIRTVDIGKIQIGTFDTKEEAHEAYRQASIKYHGEFSPYKV